MTEGQVAAASQGQAVPCTAAAPVCAQTADGAAPRLHIPSVNVIGLPASTAFFFDANGHLIQTVVLFTNAAPALRGRSTCGTTQSTSTAFSRRWTRPKGANIFVPCSNGVFDDAIADCTVEYADQTHKDHRAFVKAIRQGRIKAALDD